jgi:alpha-glucuronidase
MKTKAFIFICLSVFLFACKSELQVVVPENGGQLEKLAASEIRKYIYLRSGDLAVISSKPDPGKEQIVLQIDPVLGDQEFSLQTKNSGKNKTVTISGGSGIAVLYGAYELAEQLRVCFYL